MPSMFDRDVAVDFTRGGNYVTVHRATRSGHSGDRVTMSLPHFVKLFRQVANEAGKDYMRNIYRSFDKPFIDPGMA